MSKKLGKVSITIPEKCSLSNLCDAVVQATGEDPEKINSEYTRLIFSQDVYNAFKAHMEGLGLSQSTAGEIWSKSGFSIDESFTGGEVEIQDTLFAIDSMIPKISKGKIAILVSLAVLIHAITYYFNHHFGNEASVAIAPFVTILKAIDVVISVVVITVASEKWEDWFINLADQHIENCKARFKKT